MQERVEDGCATVGSMAVDWARYLAAYHRDNPGITERVLSRSTHGKVGDPYRWLRSGLPQEPGVVVDVAAGNLPLRPLFSRDTRYIGCDLSESELALAAGQGRSGRVLADINRLPLADACADAAVSSMGLMLVTSPQAALNELARVLRPGGALALLLPAQWPLRPIDVLPLLSLSWALKGPGSMPNVIGARRARRLIRRAGLAPLDIRRVRFRLPIRSAADAELAVAALYTPGRSEKQRKRAVAALKPLAPNRELPVPLLRVIASRSPAD